jgi:hypothetical protein
MEWTAQKVVALIAENIGATRAEVLHALRTQLIIDATREQITFFRSKGIQPHE